MAYPDWVLKHKQPGMYVQKVNDHTYRIFRGHSERRAGKPYPVLVTDEYIGTITKEAGLVRTKPTIKGEVLVKRYGGYCLLWNLCRKLAERMMQRYGDASVFLEACLQVLYGSSSSLLYASDWMSEHQQGLEFPLAGEVLQEASRIAEGMSTTLSSRFGDDRQAVLESAGSLYRVCINGMWVTSDTSQVLWVSRRYGINWKGV